MSKTFVLYETVFVYLTGYKPKFAEPFSSKRHRDTEENLPSSGSLYGAVSPPYRHKIPMVKQYLSPSSYSSDRRPSPPPLLPFPSRSLSYTDPSLFSIIKLTKIISFLHSDQTLTSPAYHLLDNNNECRLIIRCGKTITKYHVSKLFDLVPYMEECSPISFNTFNERKKFEMKLYLMSFSFRLFHCTL